MFHGIIINGRKGPAIFWEKEYGSVNSTKYDAIILANIQAFLEEHLEGYIWMQDNASSHRSKETKINLCWRRIPHIK